MYCSTCGERLSEGMATCRACGAAAAVRAPRPQELTLRPPAPGRLFGKEIGSCPRCRYLGEGLPYFSRGPHVAGLVAATVFTLPWAMGGGGVVYYLLRRDHRICPRCGHGWGRHGSESEPADASKPVPHAAPAVAAGRGMGEGLKRGWSIALAVLAVIFLVSGIAEAELGIALASFLFGGGAVTLHIAANRARERRREALLSALQMSVLRLARERSGRLTVTEVAASLGWPIRRAEKVLQSLDDGWRVDSTVTDEGVIIYEFRELRLPADGSAT